MPNHVTTRCAVSGPDDQLIEFAKQAFRSENGETIFDFNAFVPMPEILRNTVSGTAAINGAILLTLTRWHDSADRLIRSRKTKADVKDSAVRDAEERLGAVQVAHMRETLKLPDAPLVDVAKAWLASNPEYGEQGERRLRACLQTGFPDWYEWSVENWGTKWNAYHLKIDRSERPLEFYFDTAWSFPVPVFEKIAAAFPQLSFRCTCFDEGWNFAGDGYFNPPPGQPAFTLCDATDELFERVYGYAPEKEGTA
jgi:Ferredoxin-like domain in Api92-like protein